MTSRIIRIGLPTGIQNMVISFSNVLVQSSVNSYGAAAMAGFAAYMKIDGFNILPVTRSAWRPPPSWARTTVPATSSG